MKNKLVLLSFLMAAAANAYQNDTTALDDREVTVRVVGPTGAGVEGVTLAHRESDKNIDLCRKEITDAEGYANFIVPANEKSRFMVMRADSVLPDTAVTYQPAALQDANPVCTLRLDHNRLGTIFRLDGREVVVRVYRDWDVTNTRYRNFLMPYGEPEPFETVTLRLTGGMLVFDLPQELLETPENTCVVVIGDDQTDNAVRALLADVIYAKSYKPKLKFDLCTSRPFVGGGYAIFVDALGNPLAGAVVELYVSDFHNPTGIPVRTTVLDKKGRLKMPRAAIYPAEFTVILSHPYYGKAIVRHVWAGGDERFVTPLLKNGTGDELRSIWGRVVEPNGAPVVGAMVIIGSAVTPGGGTVRSSAKPSTCILTDEQGTFGVYLLPDLSRTDLEGLPAYCKYKVEIWPARSSDLLRYSGSMLPGGEKTIVLEKIDAPFRTFAFEDANGPITDINVLEQICILVERKGRLTYRVTYRDIKDGRKLPLGTYKVDPYGVEISEFEPMEVTAESPRQLVFKTKSTEAPVYTGKVVDGTTGLPMAGAFVAVGAWLGKDISNLTPEQWEMLDRLGAVTVGDDPCVVPLREIIRFDELLRADSQGVFEFALFLRENQYSDIVAFDRDFTAIKYELSGTRQNSASNNRIALPDIPLYPAATVVFEPNVQQQECEIRTRLVYAKEGQPRWFGPFRKTWFWRLALQDQLQPNRLYSLQVPAGLNLKIRLLVADHASRRYPWWCPILTETVSASQGQVIDLGKVEIRQEMPVFVQVVDSAGKGLKGVGVTHIDRLGWSLGQTYITDEQGFAEFRVPPYYQGQFAVGPPGPARDRVTESIAYQTNGPEDANNVYTLQLSDEMLRKLFN